MTLHTGDARDRDHVIGCLKTLQRVGWAIVTGPAKRGVLGCAAREEVALSRLRLPLEQQQATAFRMDCAMHGTSRRDMKITFG